jgi:hypothetical protein
LSAVLALIGSAKPRAGLATGPETLDCTDSGRGRLPEDATAFYAGGIGEEPGAGRSAEAHRRREKGDARTDRARLAVGEEALDLPIPGTTKLHRLEENLGAVNVQLTADNLAEIERAAAAITVEGERYPAHLLATTGR